MKTSGRRTDVCWTIRTYQEGYNDDYLAEVDTRPNWLSPTLDFVELQRVTHLASLLRQNSDFDEEISPFRNLLATCLIPYRASSTMQCLVLSMAINLCLDFESLKQSCFIELILLITAWQLTTKSVAKTRLKQLIAISGSFHCSIEWGQV